MLVRIQTLFSLIVSTVNALFALAVGGVVLCRAVLFGGDLVPLARFLMDQALATAVVAAALIGLNLVRWFLKIQSASRGAREGMIAGSSREEAGYISLRAMEKSLKRVVLCLWEVDRAKLRLRRKRRSGLSIIVNYRALEGVNTVHLDHRIRAALKERVAELIHPRPETDLDIMVNLVGLAVRKRKGRAIPSPSYGGAPDFAGPRWPVEEGEKR
jgi:hypothetical protein